MRDLKADLEICNAVLPIKPKVPSDFRFMEDALFFVEAREGWPEAIEQAINAKAEVERLKTDMIDYIRGATYMTKQIQGLRAENEWLKRALSEIEDWCVEFHVTGPHDPDKALKIVMNIYDIVHEQLGDRTEEFNVKGDESK